MNSKAKKSGLTREIRWFYGVGDMCYTLMTYVYSYYQLFFLTNVAMLSLARASFIMSVCSTVDVATAMVAGGIINSAKPMRFGRYRSWLLAVSWAVPICYFFMFFRVSSNETVTTICLMAAMITGRFLHDFPYCSSASLISVVAKTADDRITMASSRATWNSAAKFAWSMVGAPLLAILTAAFTEKYAYALLAFTLACSMAGGMWVHFLITRGYEESGEEERADRKHTERSRTGLRDLFKALFANPPLLALMIADFAKWFFNFMVASTIVYYLTYVALDKGLLSVYTLLVAVMGTVGSYISRFIGRRFSGRSTMIISYCAMGILLLTGRMFYRNIWIVIGLLAAAQLFYGFVYACSTALYADTAVYYEWKNGKNAAGWIMGLSIIPLNIASMLKGIILPAALAVGGFSAAITAEEASEAMRAGIASALLVVPAVLLFLGALVLLFLYRLTREKVTQMQKELEERTDRSPKGTLPEE